MRTNANCRIVVEPNDLMRQGLMDVLSESGHSNCSAYETIEEMETNIDPDACDALFLVDLGQDEDFVKRGIGELKSRHPTSPIVLLSDIYCHRHLHIAIKAGASGYILTKTGGEALITLVKAASLGQPVIPEEALELIASDEADGLKDAPSSKGHPTKLPPGLLTDRELVVLRCLTRAMSNKHIARECKIGEATVKVHVKAILRKINGKNRTEAAIWAIDHGLKLDRPTTHPGESRIGAASEMDIKSLERSPIRQKSDQS